MKRVHFVLFVLAFALLVAGCGPSTPNSPKPFCGGIDGVDMSFIEDSPPNEVFDNNQFPFDISLRLLNKGEISVEPQDAKIELSGISNAEFGGPSYTKIVSDKIPAAYKDQTGKCVNGDPIIVAFGAAGDEPFKYKYPLPGNTPFLIRADLCYRYKTTATAQFCVQKEIPRFGQTPTCKVTDTKLVSNSGSPVNIDNFKQSPAGGGKITFSFDIVHKGTGALHSGELCDSSLANRNKVHVRVSSRVGSITCSSLNGISEGDLIISDGKSRVVTCVMDASAISGREFETPLDIEVGYNYKIHKDANIVVKHLGN